MRTDRDEEILTGMDVFGGRDVPPEMLRRALRLHPAVFYPRMRRLVRRGAITRRRWRNRVFLDLVVDGESVHVRARRLAEQQLTRIEGRLRDEGRGARPEEVLEVLDWIGFHAGPLRGTTGPGRPRKASGLESALVRLRHVNGREVERAARRILALAMVEELSGLPLPLREVNH